MYGTQLSETGEGNGRNRFQNAGKFTLIESKYFCADCQVFFKRLDLKYANDFIVKCVLLFSNLYSDMCGRMLKSLEVQNEVKN